MQRNTIFLHRIVQIELRATHNTGTENAQE